jgi:hypothetical protein
LACDASSVVAASGALNFLWVACRSIAKPESAGGQPFGNCGGRNRQKNVIDGLSISPALYYDERRFGLGWKKFAELKRLTGIAQTNTMQCGK